MATREELKLLINQLPEPCLDAARTMLEHYMRPPQPPSPLLERMQDRSLQYRRLVQQRFRETGRPGTIGSMSGTGHLGDHEGTPFGRQGFHYWDGKALVDQTLQLFDGQEMEIMRRISLSTDRTRLNCIVELSSGGHTVRHEDDFPVGQD